MEESTQELPPEIFGISETKDVLAFAFSFGNAMGKSLADGKIGMADFPNFLPAVMKLPAAVGSISQVPLELSHLSEEERVELFAYAKSEFDLADDRIEGAILDGLRLVSDIHGYVRKYFLA